VNEEERAKRLSDAIDAMLRGGDPELDLDDNDLIELLRIARVRHRAGQALSDVGLAYRELLLRVLQARTVARQMGQDSESRSSLPGEPYPLEHPAQQPSREARDRIGQQERAPYATHRVLAYQARVPSPPHAIAPGTGGSGLSSLAGLHRPGSRRGTPCLTQDGVRLSLTDCGPSRDRPS
jgi:hypothetical protein